MATSVQLRSNKKDGTWRHMNICKMSFLCAFLMLSCCWKQVAPQKTPRWDAPWIEKEHDPLRYKMTPAPVDELGDPLNPETPTYYSEESLYLAYRPNFYAETHRPYRMSPHYKQAYLWNYQRKTENIFSVGCYCTTVFMRLTPLAGCAVITTRHALTTATSTHLILRDRYDFQSMENILGLWYDTSHDNYNSSMYMTPVRIHYHPLWHYPEQVNRSHPLSVTFDLAVWAVAYNFYGFYLNSNSAEICLRATSHKSVWGAPTPTNELFLVIGFQYIFAYKRVPMPWFKYAIRTRATIDPCPKAEWGWFICIYGDWLKYGIDSGAALHRSFQGESWKLDGLVAMGAFSMKLRTTELTHYFTILDTHPVLDFIYEAFESRKTPVFLDERFYDTKGAAPKLKPDYRLDRSYDIGSQYIFEPYWDK